MTSISEVEDIPHLGLTKSVCRAFHDSGIKNIVAAESIKDVIAAVGFEAVINAIGVEHAVQELFPANRKRLKELL